MIRIIILFLLLISSIYSQEAEVKEEPKSDSQSERRMNRKWIVGISPNQEFLLKNRKSIGIQYNWRESFSFGFRYMHFREKSVENYAYPELKDFQRKETINQQDFLHGYLKYYPFASFVSLSMGFGRNFGSEKSDSTYINLNSRSVTNRLESITLFSQDLSPYYYRYLGFGLDWLFSNGIFLGLDISRTYPINRKYHSHYTIIPVRTGFYTTSNLENIFLYNQSKNSNPNHLSARDLDSIFINFWIGYAF